MRKSDFFQNFFSFSNPRIDLCHRKQDDDTLLTRNGKDMFTLLECIAYLEVT